MQSQDKDYRVFLLNSYSGPARKIICYVCINEIINLTQLPGVAIS